MRLKRDSPLMYAAVVVASPVLLLAGEPLARAYLRRQRAKATPTTGGGFSAVRGGTMGAFDGHAFFFNPLAIALTAPGRWVGDRLRR